MAGGGERRLADLQRSGRALLITADTTAVLSWNDRVDIVAGTCALSPGASLLVGPDGLVGWKSYVVPPPEDALGRAAG